MRRTARGWLSVIALAALVGCDGGVPGGDAGEACVDDMGCDDGLYCNGIERCAPESAEADLRGCVREDSGRCPAGQTCDEDARGCVGSCETPDADGDGHIAVSCGGADCDDDDPERFPGATEVCDADDEDCDASTLGERDVDEDGQTSAMCCDGVTCGPDCDDAIAAVYRGATEACNGVDDDCDGGTDEGLSAGRYYPDCDGDGAGASDGSGTVGCGGPPSEVACAGGSSGAGWSLSSGDCDDTVASVRPGAVELCNGVDDDCDGATDEDDLTCYQDLDGDGYGNPTVTATADCECPAGYVVMGGDCDDRTGVGTATHPTATELCDGYDNNCNGLLDYPGEDDDGDGFADRAICVGAPNATDCDDAQIDVHPGVVEVAGNGRDDDCDGLEVCYVNTDQDAVGSATTVSTADVACSPSMGHATGSGDCCDSEPRAFPGQAAYSTTPRATCGGYDFNCVSGDELEPLTSTAISTGACSSSSSCAGSTLTPGWDGGPPTTCGATARYNTGCMSFSGGGVTFCRTVYTTVTRGCR